MKFTWRARPAQRRNAAMHRKTFSPKEVLPALGLRGRRCYAPASQSFSPWTHRILMQTVSPPPYQDRISTMPTVDSSRMANAIRALAMDGVEKANSGHPGLPMGMADVATVLFTKFLKYDAADPHWPDRDRFILSAGHGSMLLYALLYLTGYKEMTLDQIKNFRQLNSKTPGHPENFITQGVETTTGPLGQGVATSVGFALAERLLATEFGGD